MRSDQVAERLKRFDLAFRLGAQDVLAGRPLDSDDIARRLRRKRLSYWELHQKQKAYEEGRLWAIEALFCTKRRRESQRGRKCADVGTGGLASNLK